MHNGECHSVLLSLTNTLTLKGSSILSLITGEVDQHLHLLVKVLPRWCTLHKVRSGTFLKINKTCELSSITDELNTLIQQRR